MSHLTAASSRAFIFFQGAGTPFASTPTQQLAPFFPTTTPKRRAEGRTEARVVLDFGFQLSRDVAKPKGSEGAVRVYRAWISGLNVPVEF